MPRLALVLALLTLAAPWPVAAQDVEMLGERYGTPVPGGYERSMAGDPDAFKFRRAFASRGVDLAFLRGGAAFRSGPALTLGPRSGPVLGTFNIPVVLGLYSNSNPVPPFSREAIADGYFGAGGGTITDYYDEVSGSRVSMLGDVLPWLQAPRPDTAYTVGESGLVGGALGGGGAGNFIYDLLQLSVGVDWGQYDNDGPDGVPNSGDDDGYVDVLAVLHPTRGGECGGAGSEDRIWSHRWSLSSSVGTPFVTNTLVFGSADFIRVDDYTIQPSVACSGGGLAQIGVFTHELGHAFGLPDLYDTVDGDGKHSGAGSWDLMASGSWGCNNNSPQTPCHMGAWSKAALGWVDVVTLAADTDHGTLTLPPVETSGSVYRVDAMDGSGEYFLIENRQRIGYDQNAHAEGLLVWQIDEDWVLARWSGNIVNSAPHMGVWLRQADGQDDLGNGAGRGDAGDPFPGQAANAAFHAGTTPTPYSYGGGVTGLTMMDIAPAGDDMSFRLLTTRPTITVSAVGAAAPDGLFSVDGQQVDPPETTFSSVPFQQHTLEAIAGESTGPGERRPFLAWQDDGAAPRVRVVTTPLADTGYVATYGGSQYQLSMTTTGGVNGVEPAIFSATPSSTDLWFAPGADVSVTAMPRTGFTFLRWTGVLLGQGNPASVTMSTPLDAGADFDLVYVMSDTAVALPAATQLDVQLQVENGNDPVNWTLTGGALPLGVSFGQDGRVTGASLELGSFVLTVSAVDAIGLPADGVVTLNFVQPSIPIEQLTSQFLLSGPLLTDAQKNFLNREGNALGVYDLGDFRARLLSDPSLPLSVDQVGAVYRETIVLRPADEPGVRR